MTGEFVKIYLIEVNTLDTPDEGAHHPSWPNGLIIILFKKTPIVKVTLQDSVGKIQATKQPYTFEGFGWWDIFVNHALAVQLSYFAQLKALLILHEPGKI
jgi:hypothetical protein